MATSNRGNWIVGVDLCQDNPYDGHTLSQAVATVEKTTGVLVTDTYVDRGISVTITGAKLSFTGPAAARKSLANQAKRQKRRSAIEPKIGHMKSDHRLKRCFMKGLEGDEVNAVLAVAGANLLKLLCGLPRALGFGCSAGWPEEIGPANRN